jgi:hypothetical protein
MNAESAKARMDLGDKMLKLYESGLSYDDIQQRFGLKHRTSVGGYLRDARERREKAKEKAE